MDVEPITIPDSDHHSICTFANPHEQGYDEIIRGIIDIKRRLTEDRFNLLLRDQPFSFSSHKTAPRSMTWPYRGEVIQVSFLLIDGINVDTADIKQQLSLSDLKKPSPLQQLTSSDTTPKLAFPAPATNVYSVMSLTAEPQHHDDTLSGLKPTPQRRQEPEESNVLGSSGISDEPETFSVESAWDKSSILSLGQSLDSS